ncbi:hypothetical protein ABEV55_14710 [Aneurinibacillus thermoaerophilus]|uniref:hypothetical protein n=1 Tax=Aneurinibacillus thermoaerophilus TaxID=143495 RepID=UPI002E1BEFD6|nr:hypothetical protein [Aneurinibacillus thermoaerophilus]
MKRNWELDELIDHFTFLPNEMREIGNKANETRIGFAVLCELPPLQKPYGFKWG